MTGTEILEGRKKEQREVMRGERPDLLGVSLRFRYAFVAPVASLRGALMAIVGGGRGGCRDCGTWPYNRIVR